MFKSLFKITNLLFILSMLACCSRGSSGGGDEPAPPTPTPPTPVTNEIDVWLTKGDQSVLLAKQSGILVFSSVINTHPYLDINPGQTYQSIDGFGYTLTGGSVEVINRLTASKKEELLQNLFGNSESSIGVSYLRLSIGASDLNSEVFSYNDLPSGQTDLNLEHFTMEKDQPVIDMLKKILTINPNIQIIATPWSPPVWMKDNGSTIGGSLKPEYYGVYARYFVKYIQQMKTQGITIHAITPQNEPLHAGNNPSLYMTAEQQRDFIKNHLGPAFQEVGITTKIIAWDHNADNIAYSTTILSDPEAAKFVDGSAFHLYNGSISNLSSLRNAFPSKNIYFTEQYTSSDGAFSGDLMWHLENVIVGSMRNWSKNALEWNLANDANFKPYTPGGCTVCKGAITVLSGENYTKNVAYYIIAHASKFVPYNSVRIQSGNVSGIDNVAFKTPAGKTVLIASNKGNSAATFNIRVNGKWATVTLDATSVATYIF